MYNDFIMIWSHSPDELQAIYDRFDTAKLLKPTDLIHPTLERLGISSDPIEYFEISPRAHSAVGRLVVAYVHLHESGDREGQLDTSLPRIYGVTSRPNAFDSPSSEKRSQQAHVYAEDVALRSGILTPRGRAIGEIMASRLIPKPYLEAYGKDRVAHLKALRAETQNRNLVERAKQRALLGQEIDNAITTLENTIAARMSAPDINY